MIATEGLTKRFGSLVAVDHVDLDVRPGDIYGFLGANGSGKTTTVRMLLGLVLPTSGTVRLIDQPMPQGAGRVLPRVGALVEGPAAYRHLSGRTHLSLLDSMGPGGDFRTRKRRIDVALEQVGMAGVDARPVKAYSLGMRQRLGLAAALMRSPELLILDEPTNGLDPQGIRETRELLQQLNDDGVTIFLSSHLLAEVEQLCTRVGVLDRGRVVLQSDMVDLQAPTGRVVVRTRDVSLARAEMGPSVAEYDEGGVTVVSDDPAALNAQLVARGVRVDSLTPEHLSLEEVILQTTGPSADRIDRAEDIDRLDDIVETDRAFG
jgi:ABC-type multidrug transport system ATPase subunit